MIVPLGPSVVSKRQLYVSFPSSETDAIGAARETDDDLLVLWPLACVSRLSLVSEFIAQVWYMYRRSLKPSRYS